MRQTFHNREVYLTIVSQLRKSREWNISLRYIKFFCEQGRIKGMQPLGKVLVIPKDAERSADRRFLKISKEIFVLKII